MVLLSSDVASESSRKRGDFQVAVRLFLPTGWPSFRRQGAGCGWKDRKAFVLTQANRAA
jgi:hypothetical protein